MEHLLLLSMAYAATNPLQHVLPDPNTTINDVPPAVRQQWMRTAHAAPQTILNDPCPFAPFGTAIVNHTNNPAGELICLGANQNSQTGNPTLHGEMTAIANCTSILTSPPYSLSPSSALSAFADLTLYTNAESCPMCASAIRWAGFREYVFGVSIEELIRLGWGQIRIASQDVFATSWDVGEGVVSTGMLGGVLGEAMGRAFGWQFDGNGECPEGCGRVEGRCSRV